jgi:hypothetical protein
MMLAMPVGRVTSDLEPRPAVLCATAITLGDFDHTSQVQKIDI